MKINIKDGNVMLIDKEDEHFIHNKSLWSFASGKTRYAAIQIGDRAVPIHRLVMGAGKGVVVDHINRNGLDNRKENLRLCTNEQNIHNSCKRKHNTSGYKGVYYIKRNKVWIAKVVVNGVQNYLGSSKNKQEAVEIYNAKIKQFIGEFAYLNEIIKIDVDKNK